MKMKKTKKRVEQEASEQTNHIQPHEVLDVEVRAMNSVKQTPVHDGLSRMHDARKRTTKKKKMVTLTRKTATTTGPGR